MNKNFEKAYRKAWTLNHLAEEYKVPRSLIQALYQQVADDYEEEFMDETQKFDLLLGMIKRNLEIRQRMIEKERDQTRRQTMLYELAKSFKDLKAVEKELKIR